MEEINIQEWDGLQPDPDKRQNKDRTSLNRSIQQISDASPDQPSNNIG